MALKYSKRTRFDRTRRNILIAVALLVVVLVSSGVAGLIATRGEADQRNQNVLPRRLELWAVQPDGTLRTVAIFHPLDASIGGSTIEVVQVASPLFRSEEDVVSIEPFGGTQTDSETGHGTGADGDLLYYLLTLERPAGAEPYGADTRVQNAPYLSADTFDPARQLLSLGAVPQEQPYYQQVIVAVAVPDEWQSGVSDLSDFQPYRQTRIGGWQVYYFDVTAITETGAIRVHFLPDADTGVRDLDYWRVDLRR